MAKKQKAEQEQEEPQLCANCGSVKLQDEDGKWYCPNCDGAIDWGMDEDD